MIETRCLKNVVIFVQTILSFVLARKILINNVAIVYVEGSAYKIYFWYMSKDDAINLVDKRGVL